MSLKPPSTPWRSLWWPTGRRSPDGISTSFSSVCRTSEWSVSGSRRCAPPFEMDLRSLSDHCHRGRIMGVLIGRHQWPRKRQRRFEFRIHHHRVFTQIWSPSRSWKINQPLPTPPKQRALFSSLIEGWRDKNLEPPALMSSSACPGDESRTGCSCGKSESCTGNQKGSFQGAFQDPGGCRAQRYRSPTCAKA